MAYLVETNILMRLANPNDALYSVAEGAIVTLRLRGEVLRTAPQNLVEFRNGATRPANVNGLGLSVTIVETQAAEFEALFPILPETPDIFPAWKSLVQAAGGIGKQVHDARLVAVCPVYDITHVLTFNVQHFARLSAYGPGLIVGDPRSV